MLAGSFSCCVTANAANKLFPPNFTISGPDTVCSGTQATYTVIPYFINPNYIYTWQVLSGGTLVTAAADSAVVLFNLPPSATIKLVVIDTVLQVAYSAYFNVTVLSPPDPFITSDVAIGCASQKDSTEHEGNSTPDSSKQAGCMQVCQGSTVVFTAHGEPGSTYHWTVNGGTIISAAADTVVVRWDSIGAGQVMVTETTSYGCSATATLCVKVIPKPHAAFGIIPKSVFTSGQTCTYRLLSFIDSSSLGGGSPIVSWFWDFGDGHYSYSPNPTHEYTQVGNYIITLVIFNACHCSDTTTFEIDVIQADPIQVECASVTCENREVFYTLFNKPCSPLNWEVIGGDITSGNPSDTTIGITWNHVDSTGFGYITAGCKDCPTSLKIPVILNHGTIRGKQQVCQGEEYLYTLPQWPATEFNWSISQGGILYTTDQPNEMVIIPDGTTPTITLKCIYQNSLVGCGGVAAITLNVVPKAEILGPKLSCVGETPLYKLSGGYSGTWLLTNSVGDTISTGTGNTISPTFPAAGNFILHTSGNTFCSPISLGIQVLPIPPKPDFMLGADTVCPNIPYTYKTGNAIPGTTLNWMVISGHFPGNVPIVSGEKATLTFTGTGPYTIKVWRQYQAPVGCASDTLFKTVYRKNIPLNINGPDTVCANTFANYSASFTGADSYEWFIEMNTWGSVDSGETSPHSKVLWNNTNTTLLARLIVKMKTCGNNYYDTLLVTILPSPDLHIIAPDTVCREELFAVNVTGNPPLTGYSNVVWNFGDGSPSVSSYPVTNTTHTYTTVNTGTLNYTISVQIDNPNGCINPAFATQNIVVAPAPIAFISPPGIFHYCTGDSINQPLLVTAQNGFTITGYRWYKNGNPIANQTNSHTVTQPGFYFCIVSNNYGCSDTTNAVGFYYVDCDSCPEKDIVLNDPVVTGCGIVKATASYPPGGFNPGWFGIPPPISQAATSAIYQYHKAGMYLIGFRISYLFNGDTCTYSRVKSVIVPYIADLKYTATCGNGKYNVALLDFSNYYPTTPITNFKFYINNTLMQNGAQDSYNTMLLPGTYYLKLIISRNGYPPCTALDTLYLPPLPNADFSFSFNGACEGYPVQFTNLSTPAAGVKYFWNFGDGASVKVKTPTRVYEYASPGVFPITLTVTNSAGCQDSITKTIDIVDNQLGGSVLPPNAIACDGDFITLNCFVDNTPPAPIYTFPTQYLWQPDSFALTNHPDNDVLVTESGYYFVTLLRNTDSCFANLEAAIATFVPMPQPVITGNKEVCEKEDLKLYGSVGAGNYTYQWNLNNPAGPMLGNTATLTMPTGPNSIYFPVGIYTVYLTVSTNTPIACSRTASYMVEVHSLPLPPDWTYNVFQCMPYLLDLQVAGMQPGTYNWSSGQSGNQIFVSKGGEYTLTYTDPYGCTSDSTQVTPKSPWEYIWIYPLGCYTLCEEEFNNMSFFDIPDPIIPFDVWEGEWNQAVYLNGNNSVPDIYFLNQNGQYGYTLMLNGCQAHTEFADLQVLAFCCQLDVSVRNIWFTKDSVGCHNYLQIFINNPNGTNISVSLSSDKGIFVPATLIVPPGLHSYTIEFIPYLWVAPGAQATFKAVTYINGERCIFETTIVLPSPMLCYYNYLTGNMPAPTGFVPWEKNRKKTRDLVKKLTLVPNPASKSVKITFAIDDKIQSDNLRLTVYNTIGKKMVATRLQNKKGIKIIPTQSWSAGIYYVAFSINNGIVRVEKLIIIKQ